MTIPDFQKIMLPFLRHIENGQEHSTKETHDSLGQFFNLTPDEINQYLPSGNQKIFYNRVFWAKAYLKMAGLIENTKRAHFKITQTGLNFLQNNPDAITLKLLKYHGYLDNTRHSKGDKEIAEIDDIVTIETPEEIFENNYLKIRENLAQEILSKVKSCSPPFFENLVVELLVKMGYGGTINEAGKSVGRTGDEGIDGIIKEDRLGLDVIYIQAKRWENVVGRPELHKFVGALAGQGAKKGVFITTSWFTKEAKEYQPKNETKIVLIDGANLAQLMIDYGLGVSVQQVYELKKIDSDYFDEI